MPIGTATQSRAPFAPHLRALGGVHPVQRDPLLGQQLADAAGQQLLGHLLQCGGSCGGHAASGHELPQLPAGAGTRREEEHGVHEAVARGKLPASPAAPAGRFGGGRDFGAVPLEVEERFLQAAVREGEAGRRAGQRGGAPSSQPFRQLVLEARPGPGCRRTEAAAPRGPAATPEGVEEAVGPAQAGQAEAAAQVVEDAQGAQLQPLPLPRAGGVQQEHGAG